MRIPRLVLLLAMLASFCRGEVPQKVGEPYPLICFADAPGGRVKQPLYVLGPDGKLYSVPTDQIAEHFWGPAWQKNVNWWGDKNGRPQGAHLADFMKPKGPAISAATSWLAPHVQKVRPPNDPIPTRGPGEEDDDGPYDIRVGEHRLHASFGRVETDHAYHSAVENMTPDEEQQFRNKADWAARQAQGIVQAQRQWADALEGVPAPVLKQKYEETVKAIATLEASLGRKSHLIAFSDHPGVATMMYVGGSMDIAVRNGIIDRAEYDAMRRSADKLEKHGRRMQKLGY